MLKKIKSTIGNFGVWLIKLTAKKLKIDLIKLGYSENGILKSYSMTASGEIYFINTFLKQKVDSNSIFIDVGANKGEFSSLLRKAHPQAKIYAFEPNPNTFKLLNKNCGNSVQVINKGIGEQNGELNLFFDEDNITSEQASSDPEILKTIAKSQNLTSVKIAITTLDQFTSKNGIEKIDFLKIDTEGFELEALKGARLLLERNKIRIIQFEFNEVNVVKRRFLKDFYDCLPGFDFYRLDTNRLIPLGEWEPFHEIFKFQNIIAIKS
ncbi:MAG: FkbM family methyltransferase [Crocinitomicaceae bacterium]